MHSRPLHAVLLASLFVVLLAGRAAAVQVRTVVSFTAEPGVISDAAILGNGNIALLYPEVGRIASYTAQGKLSQHIIREAGIKQVFRPTACCVDSDGYLLVFDEAEHQLFRIASDGNIGSGVNLAYARSPAEPSLAVARLGSLFAAPKGVWALLGDKAVLARFGRDGTQAESLDLAAALAEDGPALARAQEGQPGSLYIMDFNQGAILYRLDSSAAFRRIAMPFETDGGVTLPWLQDFAVDKSGRILAATSNARNPLLLLLPQEEGYRAHPLKLSLPPNENRIAVRWCAGKYIVWTRDHPFVSVLELR